MTEVFISYAREDAPFVRRLYEDLTQNKRQVWVDWEDIPLTADWLAEAYAGIQGADTFIFVISPASVRSGPCTLELEHALENNKRLVPILRQEVSESEDQKMMHKALSAHNWLMCRDQDDYSKAFQSILKAIDTDLNYVKAHTRYIVRATEWEDKGRDASLLLRGNDLHAAESWLKESQLKQPRANELQTKYIQISRRIATRRRNLTLLATLVVTAIIGMALYSLYQRQLAVENAARAERNAAEANSLALAASAQQALFQDSNTDLALLLALEADRIPNPPPLARSVLAQAAYAPGTRGRYEGFAAGSDHVNADLAALPDGKRVLVSLADGKLSLWSLAENQENQQWDFGQAVNRVAASPTDEQALAVLDDGTLVLLNLANGDELHRWTADNDDPSALSAVFTPDGRTAVVSYDNGDVVAWRLSDFEVTGRFEGHTERVRALAISSDGGTLASGDASGKFILWDFHTHKKLQEVTAGGDEVRALAFSPDGSQLLAGSFDNTVTLWDTDTGQKLFRLLGHTDRVRTVAFSADGNSAFSGGFDGNLIQWDVRSGALLRRFVGHAATVYGVVTLPDSHLLSASTDGTLRQWDTENGAQIFDGDEHGAEVHSVAFSPDGRLALSGADDGLSLWDMSGHKLLHHFDRQTDGVFSAAISPDGKRALSGGKDGTIVVWDLTTNQPLRTLVGHTDRVWGLAFSPDGQTALSGSWDSTLMLWDVESGRLIRVFRGHHDRVYRVAFSPDGTQALSASSDRTAILWDVATGSIVRKLEGQHSGAVYDVAFSPDGSLAITASLDHSILLWNLADGTVMRRFDGHTDDVFSVAFSPDGRMALSASLDNSVRLWDVSTGAELRRFNGHHDGVWKAVFSPDGHSFVSASKDGTVRQWRLDALEELIGWIYANRYIGKFTCEQVALYRLNLSCENGFAPVPLFKVVLTATTTLQPTPTINTTTAPVGTPTATLTPLPTITLDQVLRGTLVPGETVFLNYSGHAGEHLDISLEADKPANEAPDEERQKNRLLDTLLIVQNPDGNLLASNDDIEESVQTNSRLEGLMLPADGVYTLQVRETGNVLVGGGFTLSLQRAAPTATPTFTPTPTSEVTLEVSAEASTEAAMPEAEATAEAVLSPEATSVDAMPAGTSTP
jgi:WD40 repeat protein